MLAKNLIHTAVAISLLGLPSAALAQQQPSQWDQDGRPAQHADRNDRRDADDRRDGDDRRNVDDRRDRNSDGRSYGRNDRNYRSGRLNGDVSFFSGFDMTLRNGQQVRLHQGTVIVPTGTTIRPGMRLAIAGRTNADGSYEADRIDVLDRNGRY
ncbi:MAG: hypothetical protein M3R53_05860 [Candidatus Eremiobacteraeota bacterium]|nr:hypothetical protein [Candidatus Eremiobacteraeota bacterium]